MAKKSKPVKSTGLILMEKNGEQLEVHPTTVESHKLAGWKVMESAPQKEAEVPEEAEGEKPEE